MIVNGNKRMDLANYSVLMSVYYKEKAEFLRLAMDSIWNQTVPTDDFVLVCDGPLTTELDTVIEEMQQTHTELLVISLDINSGLGNALNVGIKHCKNELVARMDSDDISYPDRCEKQLIIFRDNPELSICSGTVQEFTDSTEKIDSERILPEKQEKILKFAKKRNPFNHPCVMYKKSAVETAGGYQDFYLLEDYYLWIRMLQKRSTGYNLQEPLLWMRAGSDMYKRRAGWKYARSQKALFKYMKDSGFISEGQYMKSTITRTASSLMPNGLREFAYKKVLRKVRGQE